MKTHRKLRAGANTEMTRLKKIWRETLSDEDKEHWHTVFTSTDTNAEIRKQIADKFGTHLNYDRQLLRFREWVDDQESRNKESQAMFEDEIALTAELGDKLTRDEIRELVSRAATPAASRAVISPLA